MFLPVERSITVSAPQRMDQRILSTSSSIEEATAEFPMLALILTRKLRPMIIGSDSGWLTFAGMMVQQRIARRSSCFPCCFTPEVLANRNELHLRCNDPAPRIMQLRHTRIWLRSQDRAAGGRKLFQLADVFHLRPVSGGKREITIVDRFHFATFIRLDVAAIHDPVASQTRQSGRRIAMKLGVAPWSTRIVNANRRVRGQTAVELARRVLSNLAKRHTHAGQCAVDVNATRVWQRRVVLRRFDWRCFCSCAHKSPKMRSASCPISFAQSIISPLGPNLIDFSGDTRC